MIEDSPAVGTEFQRLEVRLEESRSKFQNLVQSCRLHISELRRKTSAARALECADILEKKLNTLEDEQS